MRRVRQTRVGGTDHFLKQELLIFPNISVSTSASIFAMFRGLGPAGCVAPKNELILSSPLRCAMFAQSEIRREPAASQNSIWAVFAIIRGICAPPIPHMRALLSLLLLLPGGAQMRARLLPASAEGVRIAGLALRRGALVAFPTETVYGLGANALDAAAVRSIFAAKGRPLSDPVIVHVPAADLMLERLFLFEEGGGGEGEARRVVQALAEDFWPGPLTIVFRASALVPECVTAGSGFVGVRCPAHPLAQLLLREAGVPVAAPSANRFGHVSPTTSQHVLDDLSGEELLVLEDQAADGCSVGIESTVLRVAADGLSLSVLRCGAVTSHMLQTALSKRGCGCVVVVDNERVLRGAGGEAEVAPGQLLKHYAPDVPTFVLLEGAADGMSSAFLHRPDRAYPAAKAIVIDFGGRLLALRGTSACYWDMSPEGRADEACRRVFALLRRAEEERQRDGSLQLVVLPDLRAAAERDQVVRALWERLHRAASGCFVEADALR